MKGIILAGGNGTRVYPNTIALSKQIIPVYDKPTIYYPLSTLIKLGIKDILIITNHIDTFKRLFSYYNHGKDLGINISYKLQREPRGIAEAFIIGEKFIGDSAVTLILGDNIFTGINKTENGLLVHIFKSGACITGYRVNNPDQYGVVQYREFDGEFIPTYIEEKPKTYIGDTAVTGLYTYDNSCIDRAKSLVPSKRGELEITDLNNSYLKDNKLSLNILDNEHAWFDTGNSEDLFNASMFVKSLQSHTNNVIGSIELESLKASNITKSEFDELVYRMPNCKYRETLIKSTQLPFAKN